MTSRRIGVLAVLLIAASAGSARAGGSVVVGSLSTTELQTPDDRGDLVHLGNAVGASLSMLSTCGDCPGLEASTLFLFNDSGERIYDLGVSVIGSFRLKGRLAVPFVSFGLDLAATAIPRTDQPGKDRGVTLGVHGNLGLHGFLTKEIYWRGQVGYLGAGIGAITGQLSLGYVFGKGW